VISPPKAFGTGKQGASEPPLNPGASGKASRILRPLAPGRNTTTLFMVRPRLGVAILADEIARSRPLARDEIEFFNNFLASQKSSA
jgi:hypothetical protein